MIAILEDDKSIRELVLYALKNAGFEAEGFCVGEDFFNAIEKNVPQLLLLDIMLPQEDGIEILKKLRKKEATKNLPVIMLTAKDTEYDKVIGLDSGADDYLTKPFSMLELISRINALLRRSKSDENTKILQYKELSIYDDKHMVLIGTKALEFTLKEYNSLKLLLSKKGKVVTRDELLNSVWGYDFDGETRTVDVHIRTIRAKLAECGDYIETIRGVGYRMGGNDD